MLPPETDHLWGHLRRQPSLRGFVLIGGTALALRLRHRVSEDLDFIHPGPLLPRGQLDQLAREAAGLGFRFERNDEGYEHLLEKPPSLDEMRLFFQQQRDRLETKLAEEGAK